MISSLKAFSDIYDIITQYNITYILNWSLLLFYWAEQKVDSLFSFTPVLWI